jgi:hypothetical protein
MEKIPHILSQRMKLIQMISKNLTPISEKTQQLSVIKISPLIKTTPTSQLSSELQSSLS